MNRATLSKRIDRARCQVHGWQDATNDGHRAVVAALIDAFDQSESAVLVEPSLSRRTQRPPDVVLIDPEVGVAVVEVKAVEIDRIGGIEAGGTLLFKYRRPTRKNPINQVRAAMFDIKEATASAWHANLTLPFNYWVAFPHIHRAQWLSRFGRAGFCPAEFLFSDDLKRARLLKRMRATDRSPGSTAGSVRTVSLEQLQCVWKAFGDNSVLYVSPTQRPVRVVDRDTLGEQFDRQATRYKNLTDEQQRISESAWETGPRLVRGVAGSGKTIVLANNLARRLRRMCGDPEADLLGPVPRHTPPRFAAVCFNRTLVPLLKAKIDAAWQQRGDAPLPEGAVSVTSFNTLMYDLSRQGAWTYEPLKDDDNGPRAERYAEKLAALGVRDPAKHQRLLFDAIYVDEGQDFEEAEFKLLRDLCRRVAAGRGPGVGPGDAAGVGSGDESRATPTAVKGAADGAAVNGAVLGTARDARPTSEPSLFVFYDDAQNLYARPRPNWAALGLNIRGRSYVMTQCHRNPRAIIEASFNVLYGTAIEGGQTPTKEFGDIAFLTEKGLIEQVSGRYRIKFAPRAGRSPLLTLADGREREVRLILARIALLVRDDRVRPQDVLILTLTRDRASLIAGAIRREKIQGVEGVHVTFESKDALIAQPGHVTVSTIHSAKGYDAYVVLLASANEFATDVKGRACFYVGCTRAAEYLEVFAYANTGLVSELQMLLR